MRHPDGEWAGYTYEWNAQQTEATRVRGGKDRADRRPGLDLSLRGAVYGMPYCRSRHSARTGKRRNSIVS